MKIENILHENETMIHISYNDLFDILKDLYDSLILDGIEVKIRCPLTICSIEQKPKIPSLICIEFINRDYTNNFQINLFRLWDYLGNKNIEICFKQDMIGYILDKKGCVIKTYSLDDGMC